MEILKTIESTKYYKSNGNIVKAVDHVNVSISKGEFVAIVGQSGGGKSTFMHLLRRFRQAGFWKSIYRGKIHI